MSRLAERAARLQGKLDKLNEVILVEVQGAGLVALIGGTPQVRAAAVRDWLQAHAGSSAAPALLAEMKAAGVRYVRDSRVSRSYASQPSEKPAKSRRPAAPLDPAL